jgi:hypothetical protein
MSVPRFTFLVMLVLFRVAPAPAAESWPNAVRNSGFEAGITGWDSAGDPKGIAADATQAHSGTQSVRLEGFTPKSVTGVHQSISFDRPVKRPLRVSGWSKARGLEPGGGCIILLDGHYEDDTPMPRQVISFPHGTHDWQYAETTIQTAKPLKSLEVVAVLAQAKGAAWFDDIVVTLAPFTISGLRLAPSIFGGPSLSAVADLNLPAAWKAELSGPQGVVATGSGQDRPIVFNWVDRTAKFPAGAYAIRLSATENAMGETTEISQPVTLSAGPTRDYAAWIENSMKRVLPQALPISPPSRLEARLSLAGNEYESFQICLMAAPGSEIRNVHLKMGDLLSPTGKRIPASQIEWRQVGFVKLERLRKSPANEGAWPGWWPDPLLSVDQFDLKAGYTQPVWVTLHVPTGTPAGEYSGAVTVLAANQPPLIVQVHARVYGFSLPTEGHLKTAFALMNGYLELLYAKPLTATLRQQFGAFMLKHRLNPDDISRTDLPEMEDLLRFNQSGMNAFNIANMVPERGNKIWVPNAPLSDYTPAFMLRLKARLDPYIAKLRDTGLTHKAYIYTFDESDAQFFPVMREYFGMVKQRYPEVPTMTTAHIPLDPKLLRDLHVDWIVPLTSSYSYDKAEECRKAGLKVWAYVALGPREPYANFMADDPLIEARILWWQAYQQKLDGFLFWGVNIWERRNNSRPIDPALGPFLDWSITTGKANDEDYLRELHGDGVLLYPGKAGPIGSIRLANIRDGLEDHEYLWLLAKQAGVEPARKACLPVTRSLTEFTQDPAAVYAQRDRIARQIAIRQY